MVTSETSNPQRQQNVTSQPIVRTRTISTGSQNNTTNQLATSNEQPKKNIVVKTTTPPLAQPQPQMVVSQPPATTVTAPKRSNSIPQKPQNQTSVINPMKQSQSIYPSTDTRIANFNVDVNKRPNYLEGSYEPPIDINAIHSRESNTRYSVDQKGNPIARYTTGEVALDEYNKMHVNVDYSSMNKDARYTQNAESVHSHYVRETVANFPRETNLRHMGTQEYKYITHGQQYEREADETDGLVNPNERSKSYGYYDRSGERNTRVKFSLQESPAREPGMNLGQMDSLYDSMRNTNQQPEYYNQQDMPENNEYYVTKGGYVEKRKERHCCRCRCPKKAPNKHERETVTLLKDFAARTPKSTPYEIILPWSEIQENYDTNDFDSDKCRGLSSSQFYTIMNNISEVHDYNLNKFTHSK